MSSSTADAPAALSGLEGFRDRLAHLGSKRSRLMTRGFCGLAMAIVTLSACGIPTPLSKWSWLLVAGVIGLAMIRPRLGAVGMGCVCTVQALSLNGQLGFITAFLSLVFVVVCEHQALRWFSILLAPYLVRVGLGAGVPLGLALSASRQTAWFWVLVAFLWSLVHGLAVGQPRLGVAPMPDFAKAQQALQAAAPAKGTAAAKPADAAKASAAAKPLKAGKTAPAPRKTVVFDAAWFRTALGEADLGDLWDAALQFVVNTGRNGPLMAQLLLWCGIGAGARALYFRRRIKDRLALEYMEKVTRHAQHAAVPVYRRLYMAMLVGLVAFIAGYVVLAVVSKDIHYGALQVVLDVVSAAVVIVPLWAGLEGDAAAGRHGTGVRRAEHLAGHGVALKDLPVGGGDAPRRGGSLRPGPAAPGPGRAPAGGTGGGPHREPAAPAPAAPGAGAIPSPAAAPPRPSASASSGSVLPRPSLSQVGRASAAVEAVCFIDMVGSTAMGSKYGDEFVFKLKERLGEIVRGECKRQGVLFSKGTGDGFMLTFPEAENAVSAGMNILREIRRENASLPESRSIHLRMGIHMGQVNIDSRGDRIGTTANFAARIEGAKIEQLQAAEDPANVQLPEKDRILASDVVHDELKDHPGYPMRAIGYFEFKGITGLHRIYEVLVQ